MISHRLAVCFLTILTAALPFRGAADSFTIGDEDFILNGKPFQIHCGEMHYSRVPREYWAHRLRILHAMGLNTVCAYVFWNVHEPQRGEFNFSGEADVAEFCRLAQAEGLKVILRPGPYSCAEWDFGGLPWWLLKNPGIKVRTRDPRYLNACKNYLMAIGQQLAPLQISRGGPIIMVQVENEYGSFGNDKKYIGIIRDDLKAAGFNVPFFICDEASLLTNDARADIFCAANIAGDPRGRFAPLRVLQPKGPLFVSEYYPGWYDAWGLKHRTGGITKLTNNCKWMLDNKVSFSLYMAHGGTSFGFSSGANHVQFSPQCTSYDYDAPLNEAGQPTPKYYALRELYSHYLNPGETLPDVPATNAVIAIEPIELNEFAPLFDNLPKGKRIVRPQPMELLDQAHGCMLYRTKLAVVPAALLKFDQLHDYGLIFIDGKKIATLDRRQNSTNAPIADIPALTAPATLDVLVDSFGHVNYGPGIGDSKGIIGRVDLIFGATTNELDHWQVFKLPLSNDEIAGLQFGDSKSDMPGFYRGSFALKATGDTFLDLSSWGKGMVWVNGHNLGRFWNIGPQQTLYCPAPWLKVGDNQIIVYEENGAGKHTIAGLTRPILDHLLITQQ